jgi:hypothetical protein
MPRRPLTPLPPLCVLVPGLRAGAQRFRMPFERMHWVIHRVFDSSQNFEGTDAITMAVGAEQHRRPPCCQ